jgi:branched-chain amino acid transport system substrate-binding protein
MEETKVFTSIRNRILAPAALAALTFGVAACGGSSGDSGDSDVGKLDTSASALKCGMGNGNAATGAPIKVRALTTASGGIDFSSAPRSAAAFFKCVNANGGINGRPVDYAYEDDALNQQKAAQIAAKFAADKSIVALAGDATFIGCGAANPVYKKADLYSITGTGVPQSCFESSNIAPVNAGPRISTVATIQYLQSQGKADRVAQVSNKVPGVGDWSQAGAVTYAQKGGGGARVVKSILHDPASLDANSIVLAIKNAKPSAVILEDPAPMGAAMLKAALTQDLSKKYVWTCLSSCYDASFPKQIGPHWDGFISNSELQLVDAKTPDNILWRSVLQKYGTSKDPRDTFGQSGFLAAKILTDTLLKMDSKAIDRASVSKAIVGIKNYKSDILCAPWYYGEADAHNANHTTRMAVVKGGKYVELQGCTPANDPALAPILAREKSEGLAG